MKEKKPEDGGEKVISPKDVLCAIPQSSEQTDSNFSSEDQYISNFKNQSIYSQFQYAHLKGVKEHYSHKGTWSWFLIAAIAGMLLYQAILIWAVGSGWLDFSDYKWLLPALLVQNLAQVIGLAVYAVRYLFSDISAQ
ncbi:MAG: hypothetical protein OYG32_04785 [Rhodospirillaceae bacterium]|nr:hypothetical protein [Rhodospirillaceae bacterium]